MEQFSLKEYLKNPGRKVVTRDGKEVKIIYTDKKGIYPIVGLLLIDGEEYAREYLPDGRYFLNTESDKDLFFEPEKHEGWIIVNKDSEGNPYVMTQIYHSKEMAQIDTEVEDNIGVCKIEYEE